MRRCKLIIASLLFLFIQNTMGQQEQRWVLLPSHEVQAVSNRYARERAEKYDGSWQPTKADLDGLEANLSQISALEIYGWENRIHIEHPEQYYRQYVAVMVSGKRMIFVNAFREEKPPSDWRERLHIVIDGANYYWQAIFDPTTQQFSNLRINARA
jgi:hypothetical protein